MLLTNQQLVIKSRD